MTTAKIAPAVDREIELFEERLGPGNLEALRRAFDADFLNGEGEIKGPRGLFAGADMPRCQVIRPKPPVPVGRRTS